MFYTISALIILGSMKRNEQENSQLFYLQLILLFTISFWCLLGLILGIMLPSDQFEDGIHFVGNLSCAGSILYYFSPLSTIIEIIFKKDSSSLYLPLILTNQLNASMWSLYGIYALNDSSVYIPNLIGLLFTIIQLLLCYIYPSIASSSSTSSSSSSLPSTSTSITLNSNYPQYQLI